MSKERLDKLLFERGLAESRTQAQALILAGRVVVANQRIDKPGQMVDSIVDIRIKGQTPEYVSRGGLKLAAAIREFGIIAVDKICIDVGASTGGFTDCLLKAGARQVWAVDVGHNQLSWRLRQDSRVVVLEGVNARNLAAMKFPTLFEIATVDVSFISLSKILPPLARVIRETADCVALVKPQFEVGKGEVGRGGIVKNPEHHRRVLREVRELALTCDLMPMGLIESPILGAEGNREFLMHFRPTSPSLQAADIDQTIDSLTSAS